MRVKLIFTFLALVAFVSLGQAQTKEETIAWIKEKLTKYPDRSTEIIKINECEIVIKRYLNETKKDRWEEITFPTNPVSFYHNHLKFKSNVVKRLSFVNKIEHKDEVNFLVDFSREDNLGERFLKALQHLHTFCEKKKETF